MLHEVQQMRSLAAVLHLRLRGEIKAGEFSRAVVTVQSMLSLAKMMETHPTLIGNLVGIAIASIAVGGLEEMVQQPGCPNLFWSFADLPTPLVSLRHGVSGERVLLTAPFDGLLTADRPFTPEELERIMLQIERLTMVPSNTSSGVVETVKAALRNPRIRYAAWMLDTDRMAVARKRLVDHGGLKPEAVAKFPPLQVIMTDDILAFVVVLDETLRAMNLPLYQWPPKIDELPPFTREPLLADVLVPATTKLRTAAARLDQRVALLRTIEAVRLFAHENGGKLPATLADIKLPLPIDPVTGKPFEYKLAADTATLSGGNPHPGNPLTHRVYEIRLRK
ncbi:MAG: hypothetical protein ACRC7O_08340 [Fimbriiglobus sp.]